MPNTLNPPPSVIASWPKPNYVDPPTRGPALLIISSILCTLGFIVISCRLYARLIITRAFGSDDALATFAYVWTLAATVLVIIGNVHYGDGTHIWDIRPSLFKPHRLNVWWSQLSYVVGSCCIRISVQLFYRRLSVNFTRTFLWATWIGIVFNVLYMVGCFLFLLLICHPIDAYWNRFDPAWVSTHNYHCAAENVSLPLFAAISLVGDLYATCVPLALIASIPRMFKEKIALYCLFSLGFFVVAAASVRVYYNYRMMNTDYDFTWILFDTWIWTQLELYLAIFAASAPALKPFAQRVIAQNVTKSWARSRTAVSSAASSAAIVVKRASTGLVGGSGTNNKPTFLLTSYMPPALERSASLERKHDMLIENQLEYWSARERESYPHAYSNSTEKHMRSIEVRQQPDLTYLSSVMEEEETFGGFKEMESFSSLRHSPA